MERACYQRPGGALVTPEEFIERATPRYKDRGIFPYCRACSEIVEVYGVHSPNVTSRFDHKNLPADADPLDDCILANRNARFRGLEPDGWDDDRGQWLRETFFQDDNVRIAYSFCLHLCRKGNFPVSKFRSAINRADKKNIWSYADIELWVIPYILLTLENFTSAPRPGRAGYEFHFLFEKPRGTTASALWNLAHHCQIKKVFSSSGNPVKADDNPYPVSRESLLEKAGDVAWISGDLLQSLKACA